MIGIEQKLENYCEEHKITGAEKKELEKKLEDLIEKSKFECGEALGIITTQSLSEPATQMTMRAYHFAASAGIRMASGLPRLIELFDLRKEIDNVTTIHLLDNSRESAEEIAKNIVESKLNDVLLNIYYDIPNFQVTLEFSGLKELDMTLESVLSVVKKYVKKYPSSIADKVINLEEIKTYSEFRVLKQKLIELSIKGIKGTKETIILNGDDGWTIQVKGGSFEKFMLVDGVDTKNTTTTDVMAVKSVLGVEAARNALIKEISKTLEEQGVGVDKRYIGVVGDVMSVNGSLEPMSRYGLMKSKQSVLARLNFEETIKILFDSAVNNKKDDLNTLISNLVINQVCQVGTGTVKLKWKV
ncbi:MAG: hypothetical protein KAT28_00030 [Candidatus Aenigmarchaeota archaeon]|nr:hypothetical protein [Candidatus Aenigmarchaeota archaeon]